MLFLYVALYSSNSFLLGRQVYILLISSIVFLGAVISLGSIISAHPLKSLEHKEAMFLAPYASPAYIGWALASVIVLTISAALPIVSWFATYRFSMSSAICTVIFSGTLFF